MRICRSAAIRCDDRLEHDPEKWEPLFGKNHAPGIEAGCRSPRQARAQVPYFRPETSSDCTFMRSPVRKVLVAILALFLFPLAAHAVLYARKDRPASFRDADWSSVGMLAEAAAEPEARLLVFTGRTGRWKGIFAVHSWVVLKQANAASWSRYDVVGWGQPVRNNGW